MTNPLPPILENLSKDLGLALLNLILGARRGQINKWITEKESPTDQQRRTIYSLGEVVSTLRSALSVEDTKIWLVSPSEYLFGIPAKEILSRPDDVQYAALNRISRGEYHEILHQRLSYPTQESAVNGGE